MSTLKQELPSAIKLKQKDLGSLNDSFDKSITTTTASTRTSSPRTNSSDATQMFTFSNYNIKSYEKADEVNIKPNGAFEVKQYEKFDCYELKPSRSENNDINQCWSEIGKTFEFKLVSFESLSSFSLKNLNINLNFDENEDDNHFYLNELNELKNGS
jgi:hypothetical protein